VDEQEQAGRNRAAELGVEIVGTYAEPPGSASRFASRRRRMWDQLLADLQAGLWDMLIIWEVDRAQRELQQWAAFLAGCRDRGVLIHVILHRRTYDVRVRRDWKSLAEDGVDAADYSEKLSENVLRAMRANLDAGKPHGKIPYGYTREYDPHTGELLRQVIDQEQAEVIRRAAADLLAGHSLRSIVTGLNAAGTPAPCTPQWSRITLRKILGNPLYISRRVHHGTVAGPGDWPPVLEEATWYAVQAVLGAQPGGQRPTRVRWLLSGLAECGVCGAGLRVIRGRYYRCPSCYRVARSIAWLDGYVTEVVVTILEDPETLRMLTTQSGADALRQAMAAEAGKRAELDAVAAEVVAHRMTAAMAARIEAGLLPQVEAAAERVRALSAAGPVLGVAGPDARQLWETLSLEQQRAVTRALVVVRVLPAGRASARDASRIEVTLRHPPG